MGSMHSASDITNIMVPGTTALITNPCTRYIWIIDLDFFLHFPGSVSMEYSVAHSVARRGTCLLLAYLPRVKSKRKGGN